MLKQPTCLKECASERDTGMDAEMDAGMHFQMYAGIKGSLYKEIRKDYGLMCQGM